MGALFGEGPVRVRAAPPRVLRDHGFAKNARERSLDERRDDLRHEGPGDQTRALTYFDLTSYVVNAIDLDGRSTRGELVRDLRNEDSVDGVASSCQLPALSGPFNVNGEGPVARRLRIVVVEPPLALHVPPPSSGRRRRLSSARRLTRTLRSCASMTAIASECRRAAESHFATTPARHATAPPY